MKVFLILFLLWSTVIHASTESEIKELQKRIDDLEKQQSLILSSSLEPKANVHSFLRDDLTLGGFFETGYNFITGPDTETQAVNDSNNIGLNISADLGRNYRFVSQIIAATILPLQNLHNDPTTNPDSREYNNYTAVAAVTQGYIEYNLSRAYNLQGGIGYVPFGRVLQLREPVLYIRRTGPQMVRTPSLISILWQGVHLHGSRNTDTGEMGYNLYTFNPTQDAKMIGAGGRVWMSSQDEAVIGGLSSQLAEDDKETFTLIGSDLKVVSYPFEARSEYLHKFTQGSDSWSFYLMPGTWIYQEEVFIYLFADYLFGAQNETGSGSTATEDPIQKWEYGTGINWLPTSYTRFRLGFTIHDYIGGRSVIQQQNRDYFSTDISVGVAF